MESVPGTIKIALWGYFSVLTRLCSSAVPCYTYDPIRPQRPCQFGDGIEITN